MLVARIATGEAVEEFDSKSVAAQRGSLGGTARAAKLSPKKRKEIAKKAAKKRWSNPQLTALTARPVRRLSMALSFLALDSHGEQVQNAKSLA